MLSEQTKMSKGNTKDVELEKKNIFSKYPYF